jgi:hypothetical protein
VDASATVRMLHQTQEKGVAGNFAGHDLAGEQSADDVNYNRLLGALSKGIRFYDHGALVRISLRGGSTLSMMCTLSASFYAHYRSNVRSSTGRTACAQWESAKSVGGTVVVRRRARQYFRQSRYSSYYWETPKGEQSLCCAHVFAACVRLFVCTQVPYLYVHVGRRPVTEDQIKKAREFAYRKHKVNTKDTKRNGRENSG